MPLCHWPLRQAGHWAESLHQTPAHWCPLALPFCRPIPAYQLKKSNSRAINDVLVGSTCDDCLMCSSAAQGTLRASKAKQMMLSGKVCELQIQGECLVYLCFRFFCCLASCSALVPSSATASYSCRTMPRLGAVKQLHFSSRHRQATQQNCSCLITMTATTPEHSASPAQQMPPEQSRAAGPD